MLTISSISRWNKAIFFSLEEHLTPLSAGSSKNAWHHHLPVIVLAPLGIVAYGFEGIFKMIHCAKNLFSSTQPSRDFAAVLQDSRLWKYHTNSDAAFGLLKRNSPFLFGVATCTYQDSGAINCPNSQWAKWEKTHLPFSNQSGKSADLFTHYQTRAGRQEVIDRLHQLGVNSYRFSVEWSHVEPTPGNFDFDKLQVYIDLCKHLRAEGISPMVTLLHFSEPDWFHQLGSFEKEENISYFVRFAETIFPYLTKTYGGQPLVEHFCTVNEPGIEAFSRYIRGAFPPQKLFAFKQAGHFLKGALKAHALAYDRLKSIEPACKIGIVHQYLRFQTTNPFLRPLLHYLTRLINDTAMHFFKNGFFELKIPFLCRIQEKCARPKTDFIGLQYYVRPRIELTGSTSYHEPMTQMPFREDPAGLYQAILHTYDAFRAPVLITENGISTHDDTQRSRYNARALYATQKAQDVIGKENLLGYHLWSFCDNFEWDMGMKPQAFGAFALHNGQLAAVPKEGMDTFIRVATVGATPENANIA